MNKFIKNFLADTKNISSLIDIKIINNIVLAIKKINNSNYYLFDPNPNVQNYLKELLENENVKYFQLALDNTSMKKKFTINRYFEPSGVFFEICTQGRSII